MPQGEPPEDLDLDEVKRNAFVEYIGQLKAHFDKDSDEFGLLDDLEFKMSRRIIVGQGTRISIADVRLNIAARDDEETAIEKIGKFLTTLGKKLGSAELTIAKGTEGVRGAVRSVTEPLIPEKGHTEWRDINVEIVAIANAFRGTEIETSMRALREKSHRKEIGKENLRIKIGDEVLDIKKGESNAALVTKLSRFVTAVKAANPERFPKPAGKAEAAPAAPDKIFWRDVIAGIDGLMKSYPDQNYKSLVALRQMLENGEVAKGMHLLMSVGPIHLWIQTKDNDELIKEKIAVFIGELKQIASVNKKGKEAPLDSSVDKVYWRDIEAALAALEPAFSDDSNFKLLQMSVQKGILGTVKNFHAVIGGVTIDIKQSDTDTQMKDKLSAFIRELTKGGTVKLDAQTKKKFRELEEHYQDIERKNLTLERRYADASGDLRQKEKEIVRLEDAVRKLKAELQRTQAPPPPPPRTYRSYSG